MQRLTAIMRAGEADLPEELKLLGASITDHGYVVTGAPDAPDGVAGRIEGALLDEGQQIVLFAVRVWRRGAPTDQMALVPLAALRPINGHTPGAPSLQLTWTRDMLLARPAYIDASPLADSPVNSGDPSVERWVRVVPRSTRVVEPHQAVSQAAMWGLASAVLTALACILAGGGAWDAIWPAVFIGAGAGIAGAMYGASRDAVAREREFARPAPLPEPIRRLETALHHPAPEQPEYLNAVAIELRTRASVEEHGVDEHGLRFRDWINQLAKTDAGRQRLALELVRIYLGASLFTRGLLFIVRPDLIGDLLQSRQVVLPFIVQHYVVMTHLMGGIMLAVGFLTRAAAVAQLPALLGALFVVHLREGLFAPGQGLELAALVSVLLLAFVAAGGGPLSVDAYLARRERSRASQARHARPVRLPGEQVPAH